MITGTVTEDLVPTITLPVAGKAWQTIIDTGFNGDLELPEELRPFVYPRYPVRQHSYLAGGQVIEEFVYLVDFPFDGEIVVAEASFVPDDPVLLGTAMLRLYRLDMNFVARTVLLERVD